MEGDGSYQQKENVALADTQTSTDLPTELSLGEVVTSSMIPERSRPIATGDITGLKGREILYRREMGSFAGEHLPHVIGVVVSFIASYGQLARRLQSNHACGDRYSTAL